MIENENRRTNTLPLVLLIVAVVVVAAIVYWQLQRHQPVPEVAVLPPAPVVEVETPTVPSEPVAPAAGEAEPAKPLVEESPPIPEPVSKLPQLDRSDTDVIAHLLEVSDGGFQSWLIQEHLIRKFVRAINALEEGKLVSQYRPFTEPQTPFTAATIGESWQIKPDNYARYTPYLDSLEKVGPERLAQLYLHYYPLLQQAYEELGVDKGEFNEVTIRALTRITKAPVPPADAALTRPSVAYKFSAPDLEQRSSVEKLLFRLGPENSERLKKLARDLLDQLQR